MVKVPRASDTRVKKTAPSRPRLSTDAPLEAFGGGASAAERSQAARGLASDVSQVILNERKKADNAQVNEKYAELGQLELALNKERNKNKLGDALGYPERENEARDQGQQKILSSITNRRVKRRVQSDAISFSLSGQKSTQNYVSGEIDKYDRNSMLASVDIDRIVALESGDDKKIQNSITVSENRIKEYGKTHGQSDDEIELAVFNATNETHVQNINRLISINTDESKEYYSVHKKEINQKDLSEGDLNAKIKAYQQENVKAIENDLNKKALKGELSAEDILSVSADVAKGGIGADEAIKRLDKLKKINDATIKRIISNDDNSKAYNELIDKLILNTDDNFKFKEILVNAWADGFLYEDEKSDLRVLSDKLDQLKDSIGINWFESSIRWFKQFHGPTKEKLKQEDIQTITSLKSLIHRIGKGDDPQEAVKEVNKSDVAKKHPQRANYEIGKIYTESNIRFKFNGFLSVDDMDIEVVE